MSLDMSDTNLKDEVAAVAATVPTVAPAPVGQAAPQGKVIPALQPLAPAVRPPLSTTTICFHGLTGTSKTEQIRHLIKAFGRDRVGIISCERGLATVADLDPLQFTLLDPDDYARLAGKTGELLQLYLKRFASAIVWLQQNHKKLDWWVCDAANEMASIMEQFAALLMDLKKKYVSKKGNPDPRKMYGDIWLKLSKLFRDLQMLPINGYINSLTLLEKETERDGDEDIVKSITKRPWLAGKKILDAYAPKWDSTCYVYTTESASKSDPSVRLTQFIARTQGVTEGFERIVARTRTNPSRPIPTLISLGVRDSNDKRYFSLEKHWSVVRLWAAMTGQPVPDYDPLEPGWSAGAPEAAE
jgi:hypothetical protein